MKRIKRLYIVMLPVLLFMLSGCTDRFEEYNTDIKNPSEVAGEALFSNAEKGLMDQVSSTNVNRNILKLWAQYWNETTYTDETNYDVTTRNISQNIFRYYYRDALTDLQEAVSVIESTEYLLDASPAVKSNKLHIIELVRAYAYQQLVDIFGAVPYRESLNIENVYPAYDAGEFIYRDLIDRVSVAVSGLDADSESFGSADLFYGGDVSKWIKFGNALKIKLGIHLSDYDPELSRSTILSGVNGGAFASSADDALFGYLGSSPNINPLYTDLIASGRHDFVPANTLIDLMVNLDDPRLPSYATLYEDTESGSSYYKGGEYGSLSSYSTHSHIPDAISAPDFVGILLTYSEVQLYLAEASARGIDLPLSAKEYYESGIRASFAFWGAPGVDEYLSKPEVTYDAANWQELIAIQQWLSFYTRGLEGYTTWRRLDHPRMNIAESIRLESDIPVRFTYPVNEQTLNSDNYKAASNLIGGDLPSTKIFWDLH